MADIPGNQFRSLPGDIQNGTTSWRIDAVKSGDHNEFIQLVEPYRRELITHCYRMLGSLQDAEDMLQETYLRAWRRLETYEGRASFRAWLYKIATNACLDVIARRPRRTLPKELRPSSDASEPFLPPITDPIWLEPFPDELLAPIEVNPEARYDSSESITLAFLVALQKLPPRQRGVLILRDVLDWSAMDVAELLETTVSAINSLLHRARTTLEKGYPTRYHEIKPKPEDEKTRKMLEHYVHAFETANIEEFVTLLKDDATFTMPPLPMWYRGQTAIRGLVSIAVLAGDTGGRWRLIPVSVNAKHGFAWYRRDDATGQYHAFAIQVLSVDDGMCTDVTTFATPHLFSYFGFDVKL